MLKGIMLLMLILYGIFTFYKELLYEKPSYKRFRKIAILILGICIIFYIVLYYFFQINSTWIYLISISIGIIWFVIPEGFYNKYIKEKDTNYRPKNP
jgi:predicted MFS family arabinose efflux permease